jgi:hypothetical protein
MGCMYYNIHIQLELDRVLEIQEYMDQQEEIIKFRSDHYNSCSIKPSVIKHLNTLSLSVPCKLPVTPTTYKKYRH